MKHRTLFAPVFVISLAAALAGCTHKKQEGLVSFQTALRDRQHSLTSDTVVQSGDDKQIVTLLKENAKIKKAMDSFKPSDAGYAALAEALAENDMTLKRLGYDDLPQSKKDALLNKAGA